MIFVITSVPVLICVINSIKKIVVIKIILAVFLMIGCILCNYTPGIYAEGYIGFAFPFVRSYVRSLVCSFVCS